MQDIRYALRTLARQPTFTLIVVLTLALGIGANTAIFSLVYQTLLRPLPYQAADRLIFIWNTYPGINLPQATVSIPDYLDRKSQARSLEDAALYTNRPANLGGDGQPEQLRALAVTPSFFSTLGRQPFLGRAFRDADATVAADKFAILTYGLWTTRYGSDRSVVGRQIRLNGDPYEVVGVLPADFELPTRNAALLVPFAFTPQQMSDQARGNEFSTMIARLRPGATIAGANAEFKAIVDRNMERLPERRAFARTSGFAGYAVAFRDQLVGNVRASLYLLQAGVLIVMLIACANVANLLLMRSTGRYRELALRSALGAGQRRIVRQLLTESLVLAAIGGAGGLVVGLLGVRGLVALAATQLPGAPDAALNLPVLAFTLALSLVTGIAFGLVPALAVSRGDVASHLNEDGARSSASRGTSITRTSLVVIEVALALVLLVGAGLLIKSFARIEQVNPGFTSTNVLTAQLSLPASRYPDDNARRQFWQRLIDRTRSIPGAMSVGLTSNVPLSGNVSSGSYSIVGYTLAPGEAQPHGRQEVVGGDYFRAMQVPLVTGRGFNESDTGDAPRVAVIDQLLAERYFHGRTALGQQIQRFGPNTPTWTIVGVVGTINSIDLGEPVSKERIYYPVTQVNQGSMTLLIKTGVDPMTLVTPLRTLVRELDPEQPIAQVQTMDQWVAGSLNGRRTPMALLGVFGVVALLLSAVGIYGVLAFGVAQRVREFGIRQALGASPTRILSLVFAQGLRSAGLGVVVGGVGALALTRYLQSLLFGVDTRDPAVFSAVIILLMAVAALACYVPARRATRVDPMVALREG